MKNFNVLIVSLLILLPWSILAQNKYELLAKGSTLVIHGTSSIHDWEMPAAQLSGTINISESDGGIPQIDDGVFTVDALSITSGNKIMNNKTYKALNAKKYPKIIFEFKNVEKLEKSGGMVSGVINGNLTIAGVVKTLKTPILLTKNEGGNYETGGVIKLKMTDFGIAPPTAMLGALKTGDDVSIHYKFIFKNNMPLSAKGNSGF